jgi:hypothetical protein
MFWILVLLSGVGFSHIIVDGSIFATPRGWIVSKGPEWLKKLVTCYQCTGFWTGLIVGVLSGVFINEWAPKLDDGLWLERLLVIPVMYGFAVSYLSMMAAAALNYLDRPWGKDA